MIRFAPDRPRRKPNLTPMIDVVFLLLVFFMLVSRFGVDRALPLTLAAGGGADWSGPPRVVDVGPDGVALNGVPIPPDALVAALAPLMQGPGDTVVLRPRGATALQDVIGVMDRLDAAGFTRLVLVD